MTRLLAVFLAIQTLILSSRPAWAQRRREEPQANPQFQQDLNKSAAGGGPVDAEAAAPAAAGSEEESAQRPAPAVQIGAVSAAKSFPAAPVSALETRVSVRVKGAPLETFLATISAQAKVNFIISEGLENRHVTAFLQNVTVREALQILLEIKGLTYQQIGKSNTYVISPRSKAAATLITRIYTLSNIPLIPLTQTGASADASAATPGASGAAAAAADSGVAILNVLKSVLSAGTPGAGGSPGGKVALEPRTNSLIVTDIPEVFPQIEQIIQELDKKAPQVMIETQIVEIDSTRARDLGFEWGGANGELVSFTGGTRDTSFPLNLPRNLGKSQFFDPIANSVSGSGAAAASDATATGAEAAEAAPILGASLTSSIFDLSQLKVVLRALVSRSEARFLGKPKILTLNNKSATIQVSNNQAVSRQTQSTAVGATGATTATTAERVQTGLVLNVTPQVNKEGYITMLVQPSFTDVIESNISVPGAKVFDAITRSASTLVRVKNGQTLVLGGLLQSNETKVVRKVPFLGYIPLLGWLFTTTSTRRTNSDLVIFLTPTIVSD